MPNSYIHIIDRIHVVSIHDSETNIEHNPNFEYMSQFDSVVQHMAIEDYFGPPDLGCLFDFCQTLKQRLQSTDQQLALITSTSEKSLTNIALLIGAYLVLIIHKDLPSTLQCLEPMIPRTVYYHSGAKAITDFKLCLQDCLAALHRAKQIGWVNFSPDCFDIDEYRQLDSPLNADLHEVVPGKIVMMCSPRDLPGGVPWRDVPKEDGRFGRRDFSPAHYAEILEQLDVCAVLRCNAPAYDRKGFEAAGIAVVDLCCEDGAAPPIDVVSKFLAVVERLPGAVAVHCGSGRGRSGTLVGLYLMKHHGFSAREAMGWLRIVRPGW